MNGARLITDTPSTICEPGSLSNLGPTLLQQGNSHHVERGGQANIAYGAYPRVNLGYTRALIDYDLLTRQDDTQNYTGSRAVRRPHAESHWLPKTIDAKRTAPPRSTTCSSSLDEARAQPGDYDASERDNIYGVLT